MNVELVFNHHSLPYGLAPLAAHGVENFLKLALSCRSYGFQTVRIGAHLDASWYPIQVRELDVHGDVQEQSAQLDNFFEVESAHSRLAFLHQNRLHNVASGKELWRQRGLLYPSLVFCGKTEQQLTHWSWSEMNLDQVKESLLSLNRVSEAWLKGQISDVRLDSFTQYGLCHKVSPESASVHQNPSWRREREFFLPTGEKVLFDWHIKFNSGIRIHLYPHPQDKCIYVAYIGTHLPTRRDAT